MISRLSIIGLFLLISFSCEKNELAVITGIVIDEVTGNPVAGASVSLKLDYIYDGQRFSNIIQGTTTHTASDGAYKIVYDIANPEIGAMSIAKPFPEYYYAYAIAPGFGGSDLHSLSDKNLNNVDIKLYHFAQIKLHVKNDFINKLDVGYLWLDREKYIPPFNKAEFCFVCKGKNFDSTFIIKDMWGNFKYSFGVNTINDYSSMGSTIQNGTITPKPDSITEFLITF